MNLLPWLGLASSEARQFICISDSEPDEPINVILSPRRKRSKQALASSDARSGPSSHRLGPKPAESYSYIPETPSSEGKGAGRRLTITSIHDSSSDELEDLCSRAKALDLRVDSDSDVELVRPIQYVVVCLS